MMLLQFTLHTYYERIGNLFKNSYRLVKGSGEIIEEIVSKSQQKQINKVSKKLSLMKSDNLFINLLDNDCLHEPRIGKILILARA